MTCQILSQRRCSHRQWCNHTYSVAIEILMRPRQLWTGGSRIGASTSAFCWRWRVGPLHQNAQYAPLDMQISSAPTVSEQIYFARPVVLKCTRDLHSIDPFVGLESTMLRHPCILFSFCYALGMMGIPVQRQWRYVSNICSAPCVHLYVRESRQHSCLMP
jgi:hypothetical protein